MHKSIWWLIFTWFDLEMTKALLATRGSCVMEVRSGSHHHQSSVMFTTKVLRYHFSMASITEHHGVSSEKYFLLYLKFCFHTVWQKPVSINGTGSGKISPLLHDLCQRICKTLKTLITKQSYNISPLSRQYQDSINYRDSIVANYQDIGFTIITQP